jgi:hypothetical protein
MKPTVQEEIRKSISIVEYDSRPNSPDIQIPEIPEWAKRLSTVFRSPASTQQAVEKSVAIMAQTSSSLL